MTNSETLASKAIRYDQTKSFFLFFMIIYLQNEYIIK